MTDLAESLATIAQVATAFAGFAGIVIALGGREHHRWSVRERNGVRVILQSALGAVFFALLPSSVGIVLVGTSAWRVSGVLFAAYHATILVWAVRVQSTFREEYPVATMMGARVVLGSFAAGSMLLFALIVAIVTASDRWLTFAYLGNLLWLLIVSVWIFAALVLESMSPRAPDG